jgi:hypothetical protein
MAVLRRAPVAPQQINAKTRNNQQVQGVLAGARPIRMPGGTGYVFPGTQSWCISQPDPAAKFPESESGIGCVPSAVALNRGISQAMSGPTATYYVAVIPDGVRAPVMRFRDGTKRSLRVTNGVAQGRFTKSGKVTEYARDGTTHEAPLPVLNDLSGGAAPATPAPPMRLSPTPPSPRQHPTP